MHSKVQIDIQHINNQTVIITLTGDVTNVSEAPIKSAYQKAIHSNINNIILNFADNHYIDSLGLAVLIRVIGEAYQKQQQLSVTLPSQHSQKIFRLLGIDHYAPIYNSLDEALNQIGVSLPN